MEEPARYLKQDQRFPLMGRTRELHALEGLLDDAAEGNTRVLLLEGEPGIGKTRLLSEAIASATHRGFRVLKGAGEELEHDRPFGPLLEALDLNGHPPQLPGPQDPSRSGDLPPPRGPDARFRLIERILTRVESLALRGPVLTVLDDLQWADAGTLAAIRRLATDLLGLPLALLSAFRSGHRGVELDHLLNRLTADGALHFHLGPLVHESIDELAAAELGATPGPRLRELLRACGGNPFFAVELLAALRDEGSIDIREGQAEVAIAAIPPSLRLVVLRRLSHYPAEMAEILRMTSVLGTSFSVPDLCAFLRREPTDVARPLEDALRAGFLEETGERLAFRHDLVREAVYEDIPTPVRKGLHLQAGRALGGAGAPALKVAPHLALGAERGDHDAVTWLRRAARDAAARDPGASAMILEHALNLCVDLPERLDLRTELLRVLLWAGRFGELEVSGKEMLAEGGLDSRAQAFARMAMSQALTFEGRFAEALEQILAIDEGLLQDPDRAFMLAYRSQLLIPAGDLEGATARAQEARQMSEAGGWWLTMCAALHALSVVAYSQGRWGEAAELVRQGMAVQDRDPTGESAFWPLRLQAFVFYQADLLEEGISVAAVGRRSSEERGLAWALHLYDSMLAWGQFYAGEWDDAVAHAETAMRVAEETGSGAAIVLTQAILANIALHRGEFQQADLALQAVERHVAASGLVQYQLQRAMWVAALLAEARGDVEGAYARLRAATEPLLGSAWVGEVRDLGPDAVRLALAHGDRDLARSITETVEALASGEAVPSAEGAALRCRGLLEADHETLIRSVEAYRRSPRLLDLALACEEAADALAHSGRIPEADPLLTEALDIYERLDAVRLSARAAHALRRLGVRRGRRGPRRRPATGWGSLSPSEQKVAALAAEGLTNPEIAERLFISRHTVGTHLRHVFEKLGLSSRVELARRYADRAN